MTGTPFHVCENEIEYLCGYINDNGTIAGYFGVPREVVETVRAGIPKRRRSQGRFLEKRTEPVSSSSGLSAYGEAHEDAYIGSQKLNAAIQGQFRKFEHEHGLQHGAGEILLPAGWAGWK